MRQLRKLARGVADGLHAGLCVLRCGQAYPRSITMEQLRRMKKRPDEGTT